jgi:hypothetical protein
VYVPRGIEHDRSQPLTDPMRYVRQEREQAVVAQIQRSLTAWRKERERHNGSPRAPIPQGGGAPLDDGLRQKMEQQLGSDLSRARIHTGGESATAAEGMGARAFTVGNEVHFGAGEYTPGTKEGDRLLAHELAHVAQGQRADVQRKIEPNPEAKSEHDESDVGGVGRRDAEGADVEAGLGVSQPDEPAEKEADAVADRVADKLHDRHGHEASDARQEHKPQEANQSHRAVDAAPQVAPKLQSAAIARKKKDEPSKPSAPTRPSTPATSPTERVKHPVPGLYESVNGGLAEKRSLQIGNLVFKDKVDQKYANGGPRQVTTFVEVPGNEKAFGQVTRSLEIAKDGSKTLVMDMAFLDAIPKEQSWVTEDGKALKPGRGIPLQTYMTIRQMKLLGIDYGDLGKPSFQKVKLSTIVNQRTIWELAELTKKEPGTPEADRLKRTHSVMYANTVITQAGAKIFDASLENPTLTTAQEYAAQKNSPEEPKKRGLASNDPVRKNFDINLKVVPFGSKGSVPSEIKLGEP